LALFLARTVQRGQQQRLEDRPALPVAIRFADRTDAILGELDL
jgi:hypothetical protein